jgi:hypothetical protein
MVKIIILVAIAILVAGCGQERSCGFFTTTIGQRIAWKGHDTVTFKISPTADAYLIAASKEAALVLNNSIGREFVVVEETYIISDSDNTIRVGPTKHPQTAFTTWKADINRLSYAKITVSQNAIKHFDLVSILLHEFGHAVGLAHSNDSQSVMFFSLGPTEIKRSFTYTDVKNLKCEYF